MMQNRLTVLLVFLASFCPLGFPPGAAADELGFGYRDLEPGVIYSTELELSEEHVDYSTFRVEVPEEAAGIRINIGNSEVDLDLFVKKDGEIESFDEADYLSVTDDYNEELFVSRFSDPPLRPGVYYFDVVYQRQKLPVRDNIPLRRAPFSVKVELIPLSENTELVPGRVFSSSLKPEAGMYETFRVNVPGGARSLRIDVFDSPADLDLLATRGRHARGIRDADFVSETYLSRESLIIRDAGSISGGLSGRWYVTVIDQVASDGPVEYRIVVGFSEEPDQVLLDLPGIPRGRSEFDRALYGTVELVCDSGMGSGCLVSPEGLILTNWHVVRGYSGRPERDIAVAVTVDPSLPPREGFRAEVLEYDSERDLALLEIVSGLYGQSLPEGYVFPYMDITEAELPSLGEPVGCIGFPGIGGTGSRASVSYTRGVVSGYERNGIGTLVKTDGLINSGSSGGAAIDATGRLIGLTTTVIEENAGQLGYIHPLALVPEDWKRIIRGE
jgi:S1-C subfamily serine protease